MSNGKLMPDGSRCWTGSKCRKHGMYFKKTFPLHAKKVEFETKKGISKVHKSEHYKAYPWLDEITVKRNQLYNQMYETYTKQNIAYENAELPKDKTVRKGINAENNNAFKTLTMESLQLSMEIDQENKDSLSHYQSSYEFLNAYLREGREGLNKLGYLQRTSPHPTKPDSVSDETLDKYAEMAEKRATELDQAISLYGRTETNQQILYRAVFVNPTNNNNKTTPEEFANKYKIGDVINEPSYLSTSLDSDYMLFYNAHLYEQQVVFEIKTNKGITLHNPADSSGSIGFLEREVLLPRNLRFKVTNVTNATYQSSYVEGIPRGNRSPEAKKRKNFTIIQLEEIE